MTAISSTTGFQAATQATFQQLKVSQARQNAERAEQTARALGRQAEAAQRTADVAQEEARSLAVQSGQARSDAGRARQGLAMLAQAGQMAERLGNVASRVADRVMGDQAGQEAAVRQPGVSAPLADGAPPAPVRNLSGQLTGGTINTTA